MGNFSKMTTLLARPANQLRASKGTTLKSAETVFQHALAEFPCQPAVDVRGG
jgi:hypothetical protein